MSYPYTAGWVRLSASGVVGDSGQPVSITGYNFDSGSTAGNAYFINGSSSVSPGNTVAFRAGGGVVSNTSAQQQMGFPVTLALGCYVSFDANTNAITVFYFKP